MIQGNSLNHLFFFLKKIQKREPFSFIRPNDGEYLIITNNTFVTQDLWKFNGGSLQQELLESIRSCRDIDNCYVGIPCSSCWDQNKTNWCINNYNINPDKLTYGNLVCNYNWKIFTNFFIDNKIKFFYIGPGETPCTTLNVIDRLYTDPFQIEKWDTEKETFKKYVFNWIENKISNSDKSLFFCFSVGPLTKILIPHLARTYKNHFFFDVGSAFDLFLKGSTNRLYINDNQLYTKIVCDFQKGHIKYLDQ